MPRQEPREVRVEVDRQMGQPGMAVPDTDSPRGPARGSVARAVVSAGDMETWYRRTGHGSPVVVLGYEFDDQERLPEPLGLLTGCCQLIVPEPVGIDLLATSPCAGQSPFTGWLRGFLEGLGIEGASVVVTAGLDGELARFLVMNPGQIERLLIIGAGSPAAPEPPPASPGRVAVWRATPQVSRDALARFLAPWEPTAGPPAPG